MKIISTSLITSIASRGNVSNTKSCPGGKGVFKHKNAKRLSSVQLFWMMGSLLKLDLGDGVRGIEIVYNLNIVHCPDCNRIWVGRHT